MKPIHLLIFTAIFTSVFVTYIVSAGVPTGFVSYVAGIGDGTLKVDLGGMEVGEREAKLSWGTSKTAVSVLKINEKVIAFSASTSFVKTVKGLEPGKRYDYVVRACDDERCIEKSNYFVTATQPVKIETKVSPITGLVVGIGAVTKTVQDSINLILYVLIGLVVVTVVGKIGYGQLANRNDITSHMKKAEGALQQDQHGEAYEHYNNARQSYSQLSNEDKLKHYDKLMQVYGQLKKRFELQNAQTLTDKYVDGTITSDELKRLNELLSK